MIDLQLTVFFQLSQQTPQQLGVRMTRRCLLGPGEDGRQGARPGPDVLLVHNLLQARQAGLNHGGSTAGRKSHWQCHKGIPEVITEAGRIARHGVVELLQNLAAEDAGFPDQVATLSHQELELLIVRRPRELDQSKSQDGSPMNSSEVGVISFVVGIGGLTQLPRSKGVDQSCFKSGLAEGELNRSMVLSGAFQDDEEVVEVVLLLGLSNLREGILEIALIVVECSGW